MLGRTELLLLRRRRARCSPGSDGCRPDDLANVFRISVSETTPVRRPERLAPGITAAGTEVKLAVTPDGNGNGDCGAEPVLAVGIRIVVSPVVVAARLPVRLPVGPAGPVETLGTGASSGVAGADGDGEADSTTHIRWE